jgi:saccharopine dehydrogenase (NAD+, L-lysine forming)
MRVLLIGAGGVGSAFVGIASRRSSFESVTVADYDGARAVRVAEAGGSRFDGVSLDASNEDAIVELIKLARCDAVLNAVDPRFVMPIYRAALRAGVTYLDMAMSLSVPSLNAPYEQTGVKLGDEQFELASQFEARGILALAGIGVEPGLSDVFARHAADHLFESIEEISVRDGANLVIDGYDFAPTFSIWTTIEECLNPPVIWEKDRGWFTTAPFSEPEVFDFPAGIGPITCVNVEHEEVLLMPRWLDVDRVTFKYGLSQEFIDVLKSIRLLGLDRTAKVDVGGVAVSPRDVIAACLPDPASLGHLMHGVTCAGTLVKGASEGGARREVYLYHVVDNEWSMSEYDAQAVVWQAALTPVLALELIASGTWSGVGLLGPEALPSDPLLDLVADCGAPWFVEERSPS